MLKKGNVLKLFLSQIVELLLKSQNIQHLEKALTRARKTHMSGHGWFHPLTVVPSPSEVKGGGINAGAGGIGKSKQEERELRLKRAHRLQD